MTPQETDPDLPMSVQGFLVELWVHGGLLQGWRALSAAVHAWDLLKEVIIIFITSTISMASGQTTGREHSPTLQQKIGLKIY